RRALRCPWSDVAERRVQPPKTGEHGPIDTERVLLLGDVRAALRVLGARRKVDGEFPKATLNGFDEGLGCGVILLRSARFLDWLSHSASHPRVGANPPSPVRTSRSDRARSPGSSGKLSTSP